MTTPGRDRAALASTLRELRREAAMTLAQVATALGVEVRTVSRYMRGDTVRVDMVRKLADAMGATPEQRRQLVKQAHRAHQGTESRLVFLRRGSGGARRMQERIREAEEAAEVVRSFACQLVPGLLQTPAYMTNVFGSVDLTDAEVAAAVASRVARQRQIQAGGDRVYLQVCTEGALHHHVESPALMAAQLEHVIELAAADLDHLRVGVIPSTRPLRRLFAMGSHDIYDDDAVVVGTDTATAWMTSEPDVAMYRTLNDRLAAVADFGPAALPTLQRVAAAYRAMEGQTRAD